MATQTSLCFEIAEPTVHSLVDMATRVIHLSRGQVAIVDEADYGWLNRFSWAAQYNAPDKRWYAFRCVRIPGTRRHERIYMHRLLLGLNKGDRKHGDHKNGDSLDNRRSNLRVATVAENRRNCKRYRTNTSGYRGVHYSKKAEKYRATITINGRRVHLGFRDTAEEAHRELYAPAAREHYGDFARLD